MMAAGSSNEGYPVALQQTGDAVIGEADFQSVLRALVGAVGQQAAVAKLANQNVAESWFYKQFTLMLRALYLNAHQHGQKAEDGDTIQRVFRAVTARTSTLNLRNIAGQDAFTAQLSPFWRRCITRLELNAKLRGLRKERFVPLLELSVVDNGPGLVRTWIANEKQQTTGKLSRVDLAAVSLKKRFG